MPNPNVPLCLLVYGNQTPMINSACAKYKKQVLGSAKEENPFAYQRFDAEEILKQNASAAHEALNVLQAAAENPPFLCEEYLVHINRMQHAKMGAGSKSSSITAAPGKGNPAKASQNPANPSKRLLDLLQGWLKKPPPGLYLLLSAEAQRESELSRPLITTLKKHARIERCTTYDDWDAAPWVAQQAKHLGFSLTQAQVAWLIESAGNDQARLNQELEKIKPLAQHGELTQQALHDLVASPKNSHIFELSQCLASKNLAASQGVISAFFRQNSAHAHPQMLGILAHQLRNWLLVHDLHRQNVPEPQWAASLKVPPFLVQRVKQQARAFSMLELERALRMISRLDILLKMHINHAKALLFEFAYALCSGQLRKAEHPWLLRPSPVLFPHF